MDRKRPSSADPKENMCAQDYSCDADLNEADAADAARGHSQRRW
jgi:hypothetical protein